MRKTYGPLKAKKCNKGKPCGGTCISRGNICRLTLKPNISIALSSVSKEINKGDILGKGWYGSVYTDRDNANIVHKYVGGGQGNELGMMPEGEVESSYSQEKEILQKLSNSSVTPKLISFDDSEMRLTMTKVEGTVLSELESEYGSAQNFPKEIIKSTLQSLVQFHKSDYTHEDYYPRNQILEKDGSVKVIDLGIAREAKSYRPKLAELMRVLKSQYLDSKHPEVESLADYTYEIPGIFGIPEDQYEIYYSQLVSRIDNL